MGQHHTHNQFFRLPVLHCGALVGTYMASYPGSVAIWPSCVVCDWSRCHSNFKKMSSSKCRKQRRVRCINCCLISITCLAILQFPKLLHIFVLSNLRISLLQLNPQASGCGLNTVDGWHTCCHTCLGRHRCRECWKITRCSRWSPS